MGSIAAIRNRLLEGLGVAVLPEYFVEPDLKSGSLLRILPHLQCRTDWFRLVWLEGHTRSDDLMAMGQFLRKRTLQ